MIKAVRCRLSATLRCSPHRRLLVIAKWNAAAKDDAGMSSWGHCRRFFVLRKAFYLSETKVDCARDLCGLIYAQDMHACKHMIFVFSLSWRIEAMLICINCSSGAYQRQADMLFCISYGPAHLVPLGGQTGLSNCASKPILRGCLQQLMYPIFYSIFYFKFYSGIVQCTLQNSV